MGRALFAAVVAAFAGATAAQAARAEEGAAIYTVGIGDRKLVELVEDPTGEGAPIAPSWSHDGRTIVFARLPCDGCAAEIRRVPIGDRGEGLGVVIANGLTPSLSATGTVVFVGFDRALYAVPLRHGRPRRVLAPSGGAPTIDQPNVSRDGRRVVFVRHDVRGRGWIETVRIDGRGRRRLTRTGAYANPAWSPDSRRVAFARQDAGGKWRICVMKADGTALRVIGRPGASDSYPTWSPDGRQIAFVRERRFGHSLYAASSIDGSGLRRLTPPTLDAIQPAWSPDGRRVAFVVNGGD
jgi:Tol biopolymer transport system component